MVDPTSNEENPLVFENLAFTTPRPDGNTKDAVGEGQWIPSVARAPFVFAEESSSWSLTSSKPVELNVEFFGDASWNHLLLFVPGVCASAETWTSQNLAKICASRQWRLAVLELEGHGLSGGSRGLPGSNWDRLVQQVQQFCMHALAIDRFQKQALGIETTPATKFVLSGGSLGGALAAYASQKFQRGNDPPDETEDFIELPKGYNFCGTLLLSPAVGVDPSVVPPKLVVATLSGLAKCIPSIGISGATPTEDPSSYACPPWTKRNFEGSWPLGTSKMLLDVTSHKVPSDVASGKLNLFVPPYSESQHVVAVIAGDRDDVVPLVAVQKFVEGMQEFVGEANAAAGAIEFHEIKKGDHSLLSQSVDDPDVSPNQRAKTQATIDKVAQFLERCEGL